MPAEFKLPLANFNDDPSFNFIGVFWQDAVAGSIAFLFMSQALIMRFLACRSVEEGRKAAAFNVLLVLPIAAVAVCCAGWIGRGMVTVQPGVLPADVQADNVFVLVVEVLSTTAGFGFFVAAVTAALMSSVDTYINASAAIAIHDIYRPMAQKLGLQKPESHYLKMARIFSVVATLLGVLAAWMFSLFQDLYSAHAFFQSTITPPLVACIFLGILWPRFNTQGAIATFVGGILFIVLGRIYPYQLIAPFAQGIPASSAGNAPYTYIGALYNLIACFGVGILVCWLSNKNRQDTSGLTIWSLAKARQTFKGSVPNDRPGSVLKKMPWQINANLPTGYVQVSPQQMDLLAAENHDLVYVRDNRTWLGGLRSAHARVLVGDVRLDKIQVSADIAAQAHLLPQRPLCVEKEF